MVVLCPRCLFAAVQYALPRLKGLCMDRLRQHLGVDNVVSLLVTADLYHAAGAVVVVVVLTKCMSFCFLLFYCTVLSVFRLVPSASAGSVVCLCLLLWVGTGGLLVRAKRNFRSRNRRTMLSSLLTHMVCLMVYRCFLYGAKFGHLLALW